MSTNIGQWFWSWGYLFIAVAVIFGFWVTNSDDRENQNHVNPDVFSTFKVIEKDCRDESFEVQTKQCSSLFKYQKECKMLSSRCSSLTFYNHLKSLGFKLPEYYQHGFSPD